MNLDREFMGLALEEAKIAYQRGDLPVGAVLTINNNLIGKGSNLATTRKDWVSHAENYLLNNLSRRIKKNKNSQIVLYSTWEPCLMCASVATISYVNRIVCLSGFYWGSIKFKSKRFTPFFS